jgi:aminoglycoside phosphotransferase (APT) family kinase protein
MEELAKFMEMSDQFFHEQFQETNKYKGKLEHAIHAMKMYKQSVDQVINEMEKNKQWLQQSIVQTKNEKQRILHEKHKNR